MTRAKRWSYRQRRQATLGARCCCRRKATRAKRWLCRRSRQATSGARCCCRRKATRAKPWSPRRNRLRQAHHQAVQDCRRSLKIQPAGNRRPLRAAVSDCLPLLHRPPPQQAVDSVCRHHHRPLRAAASDCLPLLHRPPPQQAADSACRHHRHPLRVAARGSFPLPRHRRWGADRALLPL